MIDIAFCFDKNLWMQAGVAIGSLLYSRGRCDYRIYCVVSADVPSFAKRELEASIAAYGGKNEIRFIIDGNEFNHQDRWIPPTQTIHGLQRPYISIKMKNILFSCFYNYFEMPIAISLLYILISNLPEFIKPQYL